MCEWTSVSAYLLCTSDLGAQTSCLYQATSTFAPTCTSRTARSVGHQRRHGVLHARRHLVPAGSRGVHRVRHQVGIDLVALDKHGAAVNELHTRRLVGVGPEVGSGEGMEEAVGSVNGKHQPWRRCSPSS